MAKKDVFGIGSVLFKRSLYDEGYHPSDPSHTFIGFKDGEYATSGDFELSGGFQLLTKNG